MALLKITKGYGPGLTLGCDPEFLLIRGTSPIYIERTWRSPVAGELGTDGGSNYLGELRPKPGTPSEVTSHMRTLILKARELYPDTKMVCGGGQSHGRCVGGHIHFNISIRGNYGRPPAPFGAILDRYLGKPLKMMTGGRRNSSSYGDLSDFRHQAWGCEYRTPPSWISDPLLAESVLSVAYRLAEIGRSKQGFRPGMESPMGIPDAAEYRELVPLGDHNLKLQVDRFIDYVLGGFDLATDDCFERWAAPIPYEFRPGCMVNLRNSQVKISTPPSMQNMQIRTAPKAHAPHLARVSIFNRNQEDGTCQVYSPERGRGIDIHKGEYYNTDVVIGRTRDGAGIRIDHDAVYVDHRLKPLFRRPRGGNYKFVRFGDDDEDNYKIWTSNESSISQDQIIAEFLSRPKRPRRARERRPRGMATATA